MAGLLSQLFDAGENGGDLDVTVTTDLAIGVDGSLDAISSESSSGSGESGGDSGDVSMISDANLSATLDLGVGVEATYVGDDGSVQSWSQGNDLGLDTGLGSLTGLGLAGVQDDTA